MPCSLPEDVVRKVAHHLELGSAARVAPTWRSWRWMVDCPGDRIAWIAEDDEGWNRLRREAGFDCDTCGRRMSRTEGDRSQ
jgi:hypothetical protein